MGERVWRGEGREDRDGEIVREAISPVKAAYIKCGYAVITSKTFYGCYNTHYV